MKNKQNEQNEQTWSMTWPVRKWKALGIMIVSIIISIVSYFRWFEEGFSTIVKLDVYSASLHDVRLVLMIAVCYILISIIVCCIVSIMKSSPLKSLNEDGLIGWLIFGLIGGLIGWLIGWLIAEFIGDFVVGLIVGPIGGLIGGLIVGLIEELEE